VCVGIKSNVYTSMFVFVVGPCDAFNGGCEHLCVPSGGARACTCEFGFRLDGDSKSCSAAPGKYTLLYMKVHLVVQGSIHYSVVQVVHLSLQVRTRCCP
jgi:hypothetical protein